MEKTWPKTVWITLTVWIIASNIATVLSCNEKHICKSKSCEKAASHKYFIFFVQIGSGKKGVQTGAFRNKKYWEMRKFMQKSLFFFNSAGTVLGKAKNVRIKGTIFIIHCKSLNKHPSEIYFHIKNEKIIWKASLTEHNLMT